jgi:hypothetical protein
MQNEMLAPAAALIVWSLIVLIWMTVTRFAAFNKAGISLAKVPPGGRGVNLDGVLPDKTNWKAHNFTHLMEQPTIFYPAVVIIALTGAAALDVRLAWGYVALRVVHSLWQGMVNRLLVRVMLFFVSTILLAILAVRALLATLAAAPGVIA